MTSSAPFADPLWYSRGSSPYYNESHVRLRKEIRAYYDKNIAPFCEEWEQAGEIPKEVAIKLGKDGYLATNIFPLATEYLEGVRLPGGIPAAEWDEFHDLIRMDEGSRPGYLGVSFGVAGGTAIGGPPIMRFGTQEQKDKYMPGILSGQLRFCLGITEPDAGSDVAGITTTAERQGDVYLVNGAKKWITNGIWADYCTAAVRTGGPGQGGISMLIIKLDSPGVTRKRMYNSGVHCSGSTFIDFDNVKVPVQNLLGEENKGFRIIMSNFNHERVSLCITALRHSRVCIEDAYQHAITRETFGQKLIAHQVLRAKFSTAGRSIDAAQAYLEQLVYMLGQARRNGTPDPPGFGGLVANCKVLCTQILERTNRECQQILGGLGYSRGGRGGRVEQISRDLRVTAVGGGSEEILTDFALLQEIKAMRGLAKM